MADRLILVVEDEATITGSVAARLRKERFDVEVVGDGGRRWNGPASSGQTS